MSTRDDLQIYENLPVPVILARRDLVVYANAPFARLLGLEQADLVGASVRGVIERFCAPDDRELLGRIDEARNDRLPHPLVVWTRLRDGQGGEQDVGLEIVEAPGRPGEHLCLVIDAGADGMVRRFTEALAAAAAGFMRCRDEQSLLRAARTMLVGQGLQATFFLRDGEVLRLDPALLEPAEREEIERFTGVQPGSVRLGPEDAPVLHETLASGRPAFVQDAQLSLRKAASPLARAMVRASQVYLARIDLEEGPLGVLALQGDRLTPAVAATLDLFVSHLAAAVENVRHHRRAADRLEEITHLQRAVVVQERAAAVGDAASVLAHEVRNPLGAILNAVALLKRGNGRFPTEELLGMIQEEAERIDVLIGDLLDLARPLEPRLRQLELGPLVVRAIELVQGREPPARIELESSGDGAGEVVADPNLVQMAVENLVRSAARATPPGGRVLVRIDGDETVGKVIVEDERQSAPERERLFAPFDPEQRGGAGLALAVVERVAALHGGSVEVRPRSSGGSVFELRLPRVASGSV